MGRVFCSAIFTDISESRLAFAASQGADGTVQVGRGREEHQILDDIKEMFGGESPDITIECSGAESAIRLAIQVSTLQRPAD